MLMLLDMQGCGYSLFDPEIASKELRGDDEELLFSTGNLTFKAISNFMDNHTCNLYCTLLGLKQD